MVNGTKPGTYTIVTKFLGYVIGQRLQRGSDPLPNLETNDISLGDAIKAAGIFNSYIENTTGARTPSKVKRACN